MELSATGKVILGMLASRPRSGYEIKQLVDNSARFFWAASYGQIYPELKKLEKARLVTGADSSQGARQRTTFKLTADGRRVAREWIGQPPEVLETRDEGLLKLFFAGALPPQEAVKTLRAMRNRSQETIGRLRELEPKVMAAGGYPLMVLRGGIELNEWYSDWCERMQGQLLAEAEEKEAS